MIAPERIWADPPSLFDGVDLWHEKQDGAELTAVEYIRKDASDAAIAAARAEGVREVVISRIQDLIAWLESDADNIHFLPADEVAILRDWLNGKPADEAQP